jgi:hypothetical protein
MDTPLQHERRSRQRFEFQLPVSLRLNGSDHEQRGFTQNLSARGVFLYTDTCIEEGAAVELTLVMPAEVTLAESMRVRCQGKVLRRIEHDPISNKVGIAVELQGYEYLPEQEDDSHRQADFARIAPLHEHPANEEDSVLPSRRG